MFLSPVAALLSLVIPAVLPAQEVPSELRQRIDRIMKEAGEALGIKPKGSLKLEVCTPDRLSKGLREQVTWDAALYGDVRAHVRFLSLLGLVPAAAADDPNLQNPALDAEIFSVEGILYEAPTGTLFVVPDKLTGTLGDLLIAAQAVAALQDQAHGLRSKCEKLAKEGNGDRLYAYSLLHQGEAFHMGQLVYLRMVGQEGLAKVAFEKGRNSTSASMIQQLEFNASVAPQLKQMVEGMKKLPPITFRMMMEPAHRGTYASLRLHERSGAEGVRAALEKSPPACTRDVMFLDAWIDQPRGTVSVELSPLKDLLGGGWEAEREDTIGSLVLHTLFEKDVSVAEGIARGWNGDRLQSWRKGSDRFIAGMVVFETEPAAEDFLHSLDRKFREEWHERKDVVGPPGHPAALKAGDDALGIERRDRAVAFCRGKLPIDSAKLLDALWKSKRTPVAVVAPPPPKK